LKQNKKGKNCFVICFAGKKKLLFYIYAVIVKQNFYKRSSNYYLREARLPRLQLAKRSATEFTEILYTHSTPMYRSHRSIQHPHPPAGRTGMPSVSETPDEPLLHF
jgi:hypothetical protein